MKKNILLSGLLGGIVILVWMVISTSLIPISGDIPKPITDDKEIHTALKEKIGKPGIYWLPNDSEENSSLYPDYGNEPVFFIFFAGTTPNTFEGQFIIELISVFLAPLIAAWLLSVASEEILNKYFRRVLFVTILGLFLGVYGDLFSQKPISHIIMSSINNTITWALAGLVIAWRIKGKVHKA